MSKRVRYDGAGEVIVAWPPGAVYPEKTWTVAPNHWLPDDAPAALRDELADREDWTVIDAPEPSKGGEK